MSCTRCQGFMLEEQMIDMEADYGEMWSRSARCINCRHRDDAVLRHHRRLPANQIVVSAPAVTVQETIQLSWESEMNPESVESLAA